MKVRNNGEEFNILDFVIQKGINHLGSDFASLLNNNEKELKRWRKLIDKKVIEIL